MQFLKNEKQDEISSDKPSRLLRSTNRFFTAAWAVTRACWILAAWTYALLLLDLLATSAERWLTLASSAANGLETSTLGVVGPVAWLLQAPRDINPLWSEKAVSFCLRTISFLCQLRLFEMLSRREVLLRIIGAEHITAQTVCLLLKGIAVAIGPSASANPIQEFFDSVTPPAVCCVLIVAVRTQAVILGSVMAIVPEITSSGSLGSAASFACGMLGGVYIAHSFLRVWYENLEDLESSALRMAMVIPGSVSGKAKDLLSGAIAGARKKAVQMMAMGIIKRFISWCFRPRPALTM